MKKKRKTRKNYNKMKLIIYITIFVIVMIFIVLVFIDLFITPIISSHFQFKNNSDNRKDFIAYLQLIVSIVSGIITVMIAKTAKTAENETKEIKKDKIDEIFRKYVDDLYYFLSDTIYKTADNFFNFKGTNTFFKQKEEYIKTLMFLKNKILSDSEFSFLNKIFLLTDQCNAGGEETHKFLKLLYKEIIDLNISPEMVKEKRAQGNLVEIASIEVLKILVKLKKEINELNDLKYNDNIIIKNLNKKLYIKKTYDSTHYIELKNDNIIGEISRYEPVFTKHDDKISLAAEKIYDGFFENGLFEGQGRYEYYSKEPFGNNINSFDLNIMGVNYDKNAQIIRKELEKRNVNRNARATFDGVFKSGIMLEGVIKYREKPNDLEKTFNYLNEQLNESGV